MHISGHLAVALVQHRLLTLQGQAEEDLKPLLIAALFPDAVDKSIGYVLHLMPNGRHYAHNIFSLILFSCAVASIWGRAAGYAWFVGYLGHLLADSDSLVPWFFPFKEYAFRPGEFNLKGALSIPETLFLVLILIIHRMSR